MTDTQPSETTESIGEMESPAQKVARAPARPGVYIMKDGQGRILYVGKALNLKKRLQSYFQGNRPHDPKTTVLLTKVVTFETLITSSEKEAFILEANLIKRHRPRYNVNLKDDKRYPSLKLDLSQSFPNLTIVRKIQNDGALYFGPYASSAAVRQTLKFIHKTFRLRKCKPVTFKNRTRPCLNYQMGLCLAPCSEDVDPAVYREITKEVISFLQGRTPALIRKVKRQMAKAAQEQQFEKAAQLRDKMFALEKTLEKQVTVTTDFKDRDVVGLILDHDLSVVTLLNVRSGYLLNVRHFFFENAIGAAEVQMNAFLRQFYSASRQVTPEIVVSHLPSDLELVTELLKEKKGRRVTVVQGVRGDRAKLVNMAMQNAANALDEHKRAMASQSEILERLQHRLVLRRTPRRIECYDNSNLGGTEAVSAMIVFENAAPKPEAYRRYKIRSQGKPDDYAYMAEVIRRRFEKGDTAKPWPDLILLDGGRGQLNVALAVLEELGMKDAFDVAGIAKMNPRRGEHQDKIYLPARSNAVQFGRDMDLLLLLQRIRDEAHRWAVGFQRKRRKTTTLHSALDEIPGIGPFRKAQLLKHFGGVNKIHKASLDELQALPGITLKLARMIKQTLSSTEESEAG